MASPAAVGALVVAGWAWHEAMLIAATREPSIAVRLVPGWLVALALGAVVGSICGLHRRVFQGALVVALVAAVLSASAGAVVSPGLLALPRAVLILLAGAGLVRWLCVRHPRLGPIGLALASGAVLSIVVHAYRFNFDSRSWPVLLAASILLWAQRATVRGRVVAGVVAVLVSSLGSSAIGYERRQLRRADQAPAVTRPGASGANLVLIVLDTVSAHHLALYGYHRETTPELDAFVRREATIYTEARSTSPWTFPSHASLFTGLLPAEHSATHPRIGVGRGSIVSTWPARPLPRAVPTLAELLAARGYRTEGIAANAAYLGQQFGLDRGFEHYDDRRSARLRPWATLAQTLGWHPELGRKPYRDARAITDLALRRLENGASERPFFLFVNYMDAHSPYLPPRPFDRMFTDRRSVDPLNPGRDSWSDLYDGEIAYLDRQLGRLLRALQGHRRYDDTVVVITSDHGEAFDQHGFWGHGALVYEELIRVPLYLKPLGARREERVTHRISGARVFDLMLAELGLATPGEPDAGEVVAECYRYGPMTKRFPELMLDRDVVTWFEGGLKVIVSSRGDLEVYDLASDPAETDNLAARLPDWPRLLERAERWWDENPPIDAGPEGMPERDAVERLRALGYLD